MNSENSGINEALRREIDQIWSRLGDATHYQILGLDPSASRQAIHDARAALIRKLNVPPGALPRAYTPRINVILRAAELAFAALVDPVSRLNYDRSLPRGSVVPNRPSYVSPERSTVVPNEPAQQLSRADRAQEVFSRGAFDPWEKTPLPQQLSRADRAQEVFHRGALDPWEKTPVPYAPANAPTPISKKTPPPGALQAVSSTHAPIAPAAPAVVPPPLRRTAEMVSPFAQASSDSTVPAAPTHDRAAPNPLRATMTGVFAEPSKLHAEFDVLLQEIDRLTASVQLCVSQLADVESPRRAQFHGTFHALTSTRGVLASMMATREEAAGHWDAAAKLWQRAAKAKPTDPSLTVRAAAAAQRAGTDPAAAAMLTRHANETTPEHPHAAPPSTTPRSAAR
jgi:hypothetical protein